MNLIDAVVANDATRVAALLAQGSSPHVCEDSAGVTPLHYAAQHNALLVVPLLMLAKADVFARTDSDGYTPLDIAIMFRHYHMISLLTSYLDLSQVRH